MSEHTGKIRLGFPIFLAALNMRAGIVLIAPLVPILKNYFNLSNFALSLLAGIPVLCFAGSAILMPWVAKLGSSDRVIKIALTVLTLGMVARAVSGLAGLYIFTFLVGISIAIMNYEIPAWVKEHAPRDAGFMTGGYVTVMGIFAGISVAVAVPLAHLNSWGWRTSMLPWIALAIFATLYWNFREPESKISAATKTLPFWRAKAFKNPIAWALMLFFGLQSVIFYATSTWLPTILTTKGFTLSQGAIYISVAGILGSLIGLTAPYKLSKIKDKRPVLVVLALLQILGFFMITVQRGPIIFLWLAITNIGLSIQFPVSLMLAGIKSRTPEATRTLSTMMQSMGYLIAALGPTYMGAIFDLTHSWDWALGGVMVICFIQLLVSLVVGKESIID
jgi:MFS transporter, CP family, cyanate transporter